MVEIKHFFTVRIINQIDLVCGALILVVRQFFDVFDLPYLAWKLLTAIVQVCR